MEKGAVLRGVVLAKDRQNGSPPLLFAELGYAHDIYIATKWWMRLAWRMMYWYMWRAVFTAGSPGIDRRGNE